MVLRWRVLSGFEKDEYLYKHYVLYDYATQKQNTIYGVLGIKVWLFKSEILSK
jgi:ribosomal protein S3